MLVHICILYLLLYLNKGWMKKQIRFCTLLDLAPTVFNIFLRHLNSVFGRFTALYSEFKIC